MGAFLVFEGPDGAGKSTQAALLTNELRNRGLQVLSTREPGGTEIGDAVRDLMLGGRHLSMDPLTWTFLMNAARAELVSKVIRPALKDGAIVILDRYWYSTIAYQGFGEGLGADVVRMLSLTATDGLAPDLVILLDIAPEVGLARKDSNDFNVMDKRPLDFHVRVHDAYTEMAVQDPNRWACFDADRPVDSLHAGIRNRVLQVLPVSEQIS